MRRLISGATLVLLFVLAVFSFNSFDTFVKASTEITLTSIDITTALTANINSNGGEGVGVGGTAENDIVMYGLTYGSFETEFQEFTLPKANSGLGSAETYGTMNYTICHINNSLIRVSKDYGLLYTFTLKQDAKISVSLAEAGTASNSAYVANITAFHKYSGITIDIDSKSIPPKLGSIEIPVDSIGAEYHAAAGDVIMYYIWVSNGTGFSFNKFLPVFTFSTANYDSSKRFDFAAYTAFLNLIDDKILELEEYYNSFSMSDYSMANQLKLIGILENGQIELGKARPNDDIQAVTEKYKTFMDEVKTKEQEEVALTESKNAKKTELDDYVATLNKKNYSTDNWQKVQDELNAGKTAIEAAATENGVLLAFEAAKSRIDEVQEKNSNCNNSTAQSVLPVIFTLCPLLLIVNIKKGKKQV